MYPCRETDAPEYIREFVYRLSVSWYDGILRYIVSVGVDKTLAQGFHGANFEAFSLAVQLSDRNELELDMKHRATKGGVTEKGISTFRSYFTEHYVRPPGNGWMEPLMRAFLTVRRGLLI